MVDAELRVRGALGLRIADASVMPTIPSANTQAPAATIGEFASRLPDARKNRLTDRKYRQESRRRPPYDSP